MCSEKQDLHSTERRKLRGDWIAQESEGPERFATMSQIAIWSRTVGTKELKHVLKSHWGQFKCFAESEPKSCPPHWWFAGCMLSWGVTGLFLLDNCLFFNIHHHILTQVAPLFLSTLQHLCHPFFSLRGDSFFSKPLFSRSDVLAVTCKESLTQLAGYGIAIHPQCSMMLCRVAGMPQCCSVVLHRER